MEQFDVASTLQFARYVPGGSPLHRLHPGAKALLLLCGLAALIIVHGAAGLILALALVVFATLAAGVPLAIPLSSLARALPWLIVIVLIQILTVPAARWGADYGGWWIFTLRGGQLYTALTSLVRFADLILFLALGSAVTRVNELAYAAEALSSPFARFGLPSRELSLTITIALYFTPLFGEEAARIRKSQASRGADFSTKGLGLFRRVRAYLPLFVPLLVLALRHAENLARAMEARCYTVGRGRTRLHTYPVRPQDLVAGGIAAGLVALAILHPAYSWDIAVRALFGPHG